jgi:RsiW-degrading membrane proteinase PrsW (M82 family)
MKQSIAIAGLLLMLLGIPIAIGFFCVTLLLMIDDDPSAIAVGIISFTAMVLTVGAGGATFWHGLRSQQGKISQPLRLPPTWQLGLVFVLAIPIGTLILEDYLAAGFLFPPTFLAASALPPLWAISWFNNKNEKELIWRRGIVALAGGATASVAIVVTLVILVIGIVLALSPNIVEILSEISESWFDPFSERPVSSDISTSIFFLTFVVIAIIIPLIEESVTPLVTLPVVGRLSRQGAFLVGAMAGVGFAAVESIAYAGIGFSFWAWILIVRALGAAIHPLGAGLVALGWHDVLQKKVDAWPRWFTNFGLASGIHILWNASFFIIVTIVALRDSSSLAFDLNIFAGISTGFVFVLAVVLGFVTMWMGRFITNQLESSNAEFVPGRSPIPADGMVAIWASICIAAIVPMGIVLLQIAVG